MTRNTRRRRFLLPVLLLIIGLLGMRLLIHSRRPPRQQHQPHPGALVETLTVKTAPRRITVTATGTVQPHLQVAIAPQVSGRATYVNPRLAAGGFFTRGDLLFSIEKIDYQLALEEAKEQLALAELEVIKIKSQAEVARQEWHHLQQKRDQPVNPLVIYEPQLRASKAKLAAARARLEKARLNLERTRVTAPFNCFVRRENLDPGQFLPAGKSVMEIIGTDRAEVVIPLPGEELRWLDIPRPGDRRPGAAAAIRLAGRPDSRAYHGRISRTLGEVDPQGRMKRVVVLISDPYGLREKRPAADQLAIGSFVEVKLTGRQLADIAVIPRSALRDGDVVWLVDDDNRLRSQPVEIAHREGEQLLISAGLRTGDRLVLTNLSGAAEGMKLRPLDGGKNGS
ncbi:MAG: efflux RND transporter periplasmic adaptor subunit [Deltaproteobacteria bacterium]|nr:efflux RND transporter periplasmic adaptor subunit [Deltaproteobacteria bacterium]